MQDKIWERRDTVWQLLQNGAAIYVCGDASKMAPDVRKTFAAIYQEKTGKSAEEAEQWLNKLTDETSLPGGCVGQFVIRVVLDCLHFRVVLWQTSFGPFLR